MKCEDFLYLIDDLLEDELDERTAIRLNSHLFTCQGCNVKYELLKQEREIFKHYWFDLEPSEDLLTSFQAKLKNNNSSKAVGGGHSIFGRRLKTSNLFGLYPAMAAGILILFVVIFALFKNVSYKSEPIGTKNPDIAGVNRSNPTVFPVDNFPGAKNPPVKAKSKSLIKTSGQNKNDAARIKTNSKPLSNDGSRVSEEQVRRSRLKNFETETSKQAEKIELFLRSFRNKELAEDGETYDISYEKQQARKLLERNLRLKQNAESYGTVYSAELLNKIEPLLIEIANLESGTSLEKVPEIKERLRNQNLIVSLQGY